MVAADYVCKVLNSSLLQLPINPPFHFGPFVDWLFREYRCLKSEVDYLHRRLCELKEEVAWLQHGKEQLESKTKKINDDWEVKYERLQAELQAERNSKDEWKGICIESPLSPFRDYVHEYETEGAYWRCFETSCPCCRRPVDVTILRSRPKLPEVKDTSSPLRLAYSAALWGANGGYALGAAVLGARLRELGAGRGSAPDLVLLHTDDVPKNYLALLSSVWTLREVNYIDGVEALYNTKGTNFDGVFTKLNAWTLTDYDKVMLLDLDTIPLNSLDELFQLDPPAAMLRGTCSNVTHGQKLPGRRFFVGGDSEDAPWGQTGGINAGLILLKPSDALFRRMLSEVTSATHPAHIPGNGPEQDYLTRFFAADKTMQWTHIDVTWNYQLHHVPFAMERVLDWRREVAGTEPWKQTHLDVDWLPRRLVVSAEDINLVHFSGELKLWHRYLPGAVDRLRPKDVEFQGQANMSDETFAEEMLKEFSSYKQFISRDASEQEYAFYKCIKEEDKILLLTEGREDVTPFIDKVVLHLRKVALRANECWREAAERLMHEHPALISNLEVPEVPHGFSIGSQVEVEWQPARDRGDPTSLRWLSGKVFSVHSNGHYVVKFDRGGTWGNLERHVHPDRVRSKYIEPEPGPQTESETSQEVQKDESPWQKPWNGWSWGQSDWRDPHEETTAQDEWQRSSESVNHRYAQENMCELGPTEAIDT